MTSKVFFIVFSPSFSFISTSTDSLQLPHKERFQVHFSFFCSHCFALMDISDIYFGARNDSNSNKYSFSMVKSQK